MMPRNIPADQRITRQPECENCELLKAALAENRQVQRECDTVIQVIDFLLSTIELWAKQNGSLPSGSQSEEDIKKEFADRKDKVRALFNDLIKTGEPAFIDRLFRAMNFPEDFQHFI